MDESNYTLSNLERRWSAKNLREQFILCRDHRQIPEGWRVDSIRDWHLGHHPSLPVIRLVAPEGSSAGWLLGYAIDGAGALIGSGPLRVPAPNSPTFFSDLEDWIYGHGGRFLVVTMAVGSPRVYLDPVGSLSAVYCAELAVVASTVSLVPRQGDTGELSEIARAIGIPRRSAMYPLVITPRKNVWRVLPNHFLDLTRWECTRHWPRADIERSEDVAANLDRIVRPTRRQVGALVAKGPTLLRLTAGHDSRMLLACARPWVDQITVFTAEHEHPDEAAWVDCHTAERIARDMRLRYLHLRFLPPRQEDLEEWVFATGGSVGEYRGWRTCTTYKQLPRGHADMVSPIADLTRKSDDFETPVGPDRLLAECSIEGGHPLGRQVISTWLDALPTRDPFAILDLFYLEQWGGCWAGIYPYAYNQDDRFQIFPFNHREAIIGMMALPVALRRNGSIPARLLEREWPKLLRYPFNQPFGAHKVGLTCYRTRWRLKSLASRVKRVICPNT